MQKIIIKLKDHSSMMLSHWLIGDLFDDNDDWITLRNVVNLYEMVDQQMNVKMVFHSDDINTIGDQKIPSSSYSRFRELVDNDPLLQGYEKAIQAYKFQKTGLVNPNNKGLNV